MPIQPKRDAGVYAQLLASIKKLQEQSQTLPGKFAFATDFEHTLANGEKTTRRKLFEAESAAAFTAMIKVLECLLAGTMTQDYGEFALKILLLARGMAVYASDIDYTVRCSLQVNQALSLIASVIASKQEAIITLLMPYITGIDDIFSKRKTALLASELIEVEALMSLTESADEQRTVNLAEYNFLGDYRIQQSNDHKPHTRADIKHEVDHSKINNEYLLSALDALGKLYIQITSGDSKEKLMKQYLDLFPDGSDFFVLYNLLASNGEDDLIKKIEARERQAIIGEESKECCLAIKRFQECLPWIAPQHCYNFIKKHNQLLKRQMRSASELSMILLSLAEDARFTCCKQVFKVTWLERFLVNGNMLAELLFVFPDQDKVNICLDFFGIDWLQRTIKNGEELANVLQTLPKDERLSFCANKIDKAHLSFIVKNGGKLSGQYLLKLLALFSEEECWSLCVDILSIETVQSVAKSIDLVVGILSRLHTEKRVPFCTDHFTILRLQQRTLCLADIIRIITCIPPAQRMTFAEIYLDKRHCDWNNPMCSNDIYTRFADAYREVYDITKPKFKHVDYFLQLVRLFDDNDRVQFCINYFGIRKLKSLIINLECLCKLLKVLPGAERLSFLVQHFPIAALERLLNRAATLDMLLDCFDDEADKEYLTALVTAFIRVGHYWPGEQYTNQSREDAFTILSKNPVLFRLELNKYSLSDLCWVGGIKRSIIEDTFSSGQTLLQLAAEVGSADLTWALLVRGVTTHHRRTFPFGATAYDLAKDQPCMERLLPLLDPRLESNPHIVKFKKHLEKINKAQSQEEKDELYKSAYAVPAQLKKEITDVVLCEIVRIKMYHLLVAQCLRESKKFIPGDSEKCYQVRSKWQKRANAIEAYLIPKQDWEKIQRVWQVHQSEPAIDEENTAATASSQQPTANTPFWQPGQGTRVIGVVGKEGVQCESNAGQQGNGVEMNGLGEASNQTNRQDAESSDEEVYDAGLPGLPSIYPLRGLGGSIN